MSFSTMMFFLQKWHILLREGDVKYIDNKIKIIKYIEGPKREYYGIIFSDATLFYQRRFN